MRRSSQQMCSRTLGCRARRWWTVLLRSVAFHVGQEFGHFDAQRLGLLQAVAAALASLTKTSNPAVEQFEHPTEFRAGVIGKRSRSAIVGHGAISHGRSFRM